MIDTAWIQELKDNDKVIIHEYGYNNHRYVAPVRLTATQIIVEKLRFDRQTGYLKGKFQYNRPTLHPYTDEEALQIRLSITTQQALTVLQNLDPATLDLDQCLQLHGPLVSLMQACAKVGLYTHAQADTL